MNFKVALNRNCTHELAYCHDYDQTELLKVLSIPLRKWFESFLFSFFLFRIIRSKDPAVTEFFFYLFYQRKVGQKIITRLQETLVLNPRGSYG